MLPASEGPRAEAARRRECFGSPLEARRVRTPRARRTDLDVGSRAVQASPDPALGRQLELGARAAEERGPSVRRRERTDLTEPIERRRIAVVRRGGEQQNGTSPSRDGVTHLMAIG